MTYRNGKKEYILIAVIFALLLGVLLGGVCESWIAGLVGGAVAGGLSPLIMQIALRPMEQQYARIRTALAATKTVICDGVITVDLANGWMFLTSDGLELHEIALVEAKKNRLCGIRTQGATVIRVADIQSIRTKYNRVFLTLQNGRILRIVLTSAPAWKSHIEAAMAESKAEVV